MSQDLLMKKITETEFDPVSGFLFINKPVGEPSFRTISQLRKITGQKKIGFAGTLDPAASGLLIIGFNKATKLLDLWHQYHKVYRAEITLGRVSTTYDREGEITAVSEQQPQEENIKGVLGQFKGQLQQIPPMHSAKSVGGQRLYKLARQGKEIERQPQTITIYNLTLDQYEYPRLTITVECSSGTYIRTLADDIGKALGVGAYLSGLERTAIGPIKLAQAQTIEKIEKTPWRTYLWPTR